MIEPIVFLPLSQGKVAIIDFSDFEKVGRFKWYAQKQRCGNFYAARCVGKVSIYLHCEIMGAKGVDHINGNGLDCRRGENLRLATNRQNHQASRRKIAGCSSEFRGVGWHKRDRKWRARIRANGKLFHLGYFDSEESAARTYDKAAKEKGFFKEALNFPNDL